MIIAHILNIGVIVCLTRQLLFDKICNPKVEYRKNKRESNYLLIFLELLSNNRSPTISFLQTTTEAFLFNS